MNHGSLSNQCHQNINQNINDIYKIAMNNGADGVSY